MRLEPCLVMPQERAWVDLLLLLPLLSLRVVYSYNFCFALDLCSFRSCFPCHLSPVHFARRVPGFCLCARIASVVCSRVRLFASARCLQASGCALRLLAARSCCSSTSSSLRRAVPLHRTDSLPLSLIIAIYVTSLWVLLCIWLEFLGPNTFGGDCALRRVRISRVLWSCGWSALARFVSCCFCPTCCIVC